MSQFLVNPKFIGLDSNGDPLNGGKLHTYEVGTTTNKATYPTIADMLAKTNANANPVVLDSRGEADVVLAGNTKLVLKDSDDNTIWTQDNVDVDATLVDNNGNEALAVVTTASAVNYVDITNAATGGSPRIRSLGDDSNINLNFQAKGTGFFLFAGTTGTQAKIKLAEDSDNGSNTVSIQPVASLTADRTLTLPDADVNLTAATQAQMETGTNTEVRVTPASVNYAPGVAKGWIVMDGTGTLTDSASHNVSSVGDQGTGTYQVVWDDDFSGVDYAIVATGGRGATASTDVIATVQGFDPTAGNTRIVYSDDAGSPLDVEYASVVVFGDQ